MVAQPTIYAAFIVNITRFIQWPDTAFATPNAPLVIGTFPKDAINEELDNAVLGEASGAHPLKTIRVETLADLAKCHVLYLSGSREEWRTAVAHAERKPILTISDADGFLELGGHVRFIPRPSRTQLRINVESLRASGLQARAQLLRLAQSEQ